MRYINAIVKILTFPGGLLRGFWEQLFCKIYGIPVENRKYFQFNEMAGHIEHEPIKHPTMNYFYCLVSGLMVFIAGIVFLFPAFINLFYLDIMDETMRTINYVFLYLGVSMLTNIFPSIEDSLMMWENYKKLTKIEKIFYAPGAVIMYAGAYAENFGITLLTNVALAAVILFA